MADQVHIFDFCVWIIFQNDYLKWGKDLLVNNDLVYCRENGMWLYAYVILISMLCVVLCAFVPPWCFTYLFKMEWIRHLLSAQKAVIDMGFTLRVVFSITQFCCWVSLPLFSCSITSWKSAYISAESLPEIFLAYEQFTRQWLPRTRLNFPSRILFILFTSITFITPI